MTLDWLERGINRRNKIMVDESGLSDHEFRRNIVKLAVDVDLQTILTMLCRNSLSITGQTHEELTSICQVHMAVKEMSVFRLLFRKSIIPLVSGLREL